MGKKQVFWVVSILVLVAVAAMLLLIRRPVEISVNGKIQMVTTTAFTTGAVLQEAGIPVYAVDEITPPINAWLGADAKITVQKARLVTIWTEEKGLSETFYSSKQTPNDLLAQAGLVISNADKVLVNGNLVPVDLPFPQSGELVIQVMRPRNIQVNLNGQARTLQTTTASLGAALWQAGIPVSLVDTLSIPYLEPPRSEQKASLTKAREIKITVDGKQVITRTAAPSVGKALSEAGIPLQGLDYSLPAEVMPLPENGQIQVVRVREEIQLKQTTIPYKSELVADPELELDQRRILQVGQEGVQVTRVLVRFENSKEVRRTTEAEWTAALPQNQKMGYGTKIVLRTLDTPDGPIQYWRSARVWATSMYPCGFIPFIGKCSYTTASGARLQKGVIGTGESWYRLMVNQGVYVEGYGRAVVADYGYMGGYWVDLGYSDADYVPWHQYTTLYWLTPVPSNITWILPP